MEKSLIEARIVGDVSGRSESERTQLFANGRHDIPQTPNRKTSSEERYIQRESIEIAMMQFNVIKGILNELI